MRLVFGILLLLLGAWFIQGVIRMLPLGTYRPGFLYPSTRKDLLRGSLLAAVAIGTGVFLIWG